MIDDVRLLCHEFDSLTLAWNKTVNITSSQELTIIVELISCESTEDVYLIEKVYFLKNLNARITFVFCVYCTHGIGICADDSY